jgi:inward rectifier potassium channel
MSKIRRAISRMRQGEDIGLDRTAQKGRQRTINADGSYNMERITGSVFGSFNLFHWLLTTSWNKYWIGVFSFYAMMNVLFASVYYFIGPQYIHGIPEGDSWKMFAYCFFFSAQSFTTVGYGALNPISETTNAVATIEAFSGLMTFALATGSLWGRFSKPVSRIKYSDKILIAPYKDGIGLQFMVANELRSTLMEMEARVNVSWFEDEDGGSRVRRFQQVALEIDKIAMFPTSWVINHPIDEESALYGKSLEEIRQMDFEVFVLLKGFDDVFSQTIYSRHSYMVDKFVWGAKFRRPFSINDEGRVVMDLTKVGDYDPISLPLVMPAV